MAFDIAILKSSPAHIMKLIALPDLHQDTRYVPMLADQLEQVDLVLLVGDIANASGAKGAHEMVQAIRQHNSHVLAIPGNWDDPDACAYLTGTPRSSIPAHCGKAAMLMLN